MSFATKRILMIVGLLLVTFLIGFALFSMFKKTEITGNEGNQPTTGTSTSGNLPSSGNRTSTGSTGTEGENPSGEGLPTSNIIINPGSNNYYRPPLVKQIVEEYTLFPSVSNVGATRFHNAADGKFYTLDKEGKPKLLSDQVFYNVKNVVWAKSADKAVIEYPDSSKIIYNFESKKQTTLPKHWEDFSFSPDSKQVAAKSLGLAPENRWLVTVNDDGTGTQLVEPLGQNADKVTMSWSPSRQTVAFSQTGNPQGADRREILFLGLNGENFKSMIVEGLNFEPQWSPTGKKLIYSVDSARSDFKPELWVVNSYGDTIGSGRQMLQINTWASKCAFTDDNTVVCGVPRDLPQGAGMSPAIAADTPDDLFKIDLKTGIKTPIALDKDYTISNISYDSVNRKVIFTDNHLSGAFEVSL